MKRTAHLGAGLFLTGNPSPSVIPYYPQKTRVSGREERFFRRARPEDTGISSGRVLAMLTALEEERRANVHNILVIKNGEVICECSYPGYSTNTWHLSHSMTKTVTGMAVGLLVGEGYLDVDTGICDLFPDRKFRDGRGETMTVRHLLTNTSGVRFAEAGSVSDSLWTEAFFDSTLSFAPGERFSYNSMNTYLLARVISSVSGRSLADFVGERIFLPLEIENYFWELGPEGVEKGGWGLYMSAESFAKLGLMMLSGGSFFGKRILSREWVRESLYPHARAPGTLGHFDYGYQIWVSREDDGFLFNGMLGQNVWVSPRNNIVVSLNSGNNELFQDSPALRIIERYLGQDLSREGGFAGGYADLKRKEEGFFEGRRKIKPAQKGRGLGYSLGLKSPTPFIGGWEPLLGEYVFPENNCGMLPLLVRAMQNNLEGGIDRIGFEREGEGLFMTFTEGGKDYRLKIGLYGFCEGILDFRGERYIVKAVGEAASDEDGARVYKIELLFPELPNTRIIKLSFPEEGALLMRMWENPDESVVDDFFKELTEGNASFSFIIDMLERRIGKDYIKRKMARAFSPSLVGARVGSPRFTEILAKEEQRGRIGEKGRRLIESVTDRLLKDGGGEATRGGLGAFVYGALQRLGLRGSEKADTEGISAKGQIGE